MNTRAELIDNLLNWCREELSSSTASLDRLQAGLSDVGTIGAGGFVSHKDAHMADLRRIIDDMKQLIGKIEADQA